MKPDIILTFSSKNIIPFPEGLFDYRTNRRTHGIIGSNSFSKNSEININAVSKNQHT
jgi:hypothetical protein